MCGIVGCVGPRNAVPFLLRGLERLEYRGYDSAGLAVLTPAGLQIRRTVGRVGRLAENLAQSPLEGSPGISHTRWATHGPVTGANAHPHLDATGRLALVHNGVIENHDELRQRLLEEGHVFSSDTDTEVLAHWIGKGLDSATGWDGYLAALRRALAEVRGSYAIGVLDARLEGSLLAARSGSPLVIGRGGQESFIASDEQALSGMAREILDLEDFQIARVASGSLEIFDRAGSPRSSPASRSLGLTEVDEGLGGHPHHMHKEIHEQPRCLERALEGRLDEDGATVVFAGLQRTNRQLREIQRLVLTGCGSTLHAAMFGEYVIENLARMPVECDCASEFRYRNAPLDTQTAVIVMSQSGETADAVAALRESRRKGAVVLGICNNPRSTLARESDGGIEIRAGSEIGVAATKTFTAEALALAMLGIQWGRLRGLPAAEATQLLKELQSLPELVRRTLDLEEQIARVAQRYADAPNFLFLGRQASYPVALEGALKLKEITYRFATAHPSAELKHGVIALVNPDTPAIFLAARDAVYEKNLGNIAEVKARCGPVVAFGSDGDTRLEALCDATVLLPATGGLTAPLLQCIALQLFAYHMAVALGREVDRPRNLAKSVTVE